MNHALLMSADPAWGRSSGIELMLARLGFTVCTNAADAPESKLIRLVLVDCPSAQPEGASVLDGVSLSAGSVRLAVMPADLHTLLPASGFHAVLPMPVDECTLVNALAAQRYASIAASERQTLRETIDELACGDEAIAQHFIRLLIDTNSSTLATLRDAFSTLSWDEIGSAAHRLAGSARMLDCGGMIAVLSRLEAVARERELALARALLQVVADTIDSLDVSLRELLNLTALS
jgi:HPt (histidine-containing phosphotransfer) domain-containing protein